MGDNPKKYHITDDGKIYRINEDGSFTEMGNVEERKAPEQAPEIFSPIEVKKNNSNKKKHIWIWALVCIFIIIAVGAFAILNQNYDYPVYENSAEYAYEDTVHVLGIESEDAPEVSYQYEVKDDVPPEADPSPITFASNRDYISSDDYGYYEVVFGSDGGTSIYRLNHDGSEWTTILLDNGSYELRNGMIYFHNFSNWPEGNVYLGDDDSFQLNGLYFQRGNL